MSNTLISADLQNSILQYYINAGLDYAFWSPGFNMHFGFANSNAFLNREKMLTRMSREVLERTLGGRRKGHLADFGCGVGATMRTAAALYPEIKVTGLTIVPWQKEKGEVLNGPFSDRLEIRTEDYHCSTLSDESCDGVYAIESTCYSPRSLQANLFEEIYRVLKPGGRLTIADGFLKEPSAKLPPFVNNVYEKICTNWALPGMMNIHEARVELAGNGFRNIQAEEISWRVAPSVLHVPFVILWFLLYKKLKGEKLSLQSIRNLKGSIQTLILGLQRKSFGYYLLTAEK